MRTWKDRVGLMLLAACLTPELVRAQAPADADPSIAPESLLRFRRLYAPAARAADWPRAPGVRYLPVDPDEFDRLVATLRDQQVGRGKRTGASIAKVEIHARLSGETQMTGHAALHIEHRSSGATMLPLAPWGQAISHTHWELPTVENPDGQAILGTTPNGETGVVVDRDGTLRVEWTLRGHRLPGGSTVFALTAPPCSMTSLEVELPRLLTLSVQQGQLELVTEDADRGTRLWRLAVGGQSDITLRVDRDDPNRRTWPATVRQSSAYEITFRGLEVATELELDIDHNPVQELELSLDPGLRLLSARVGKTPAEIVDSEPADSGVGSATVRLPVPLAGSGQRVQISAIAPLRLETPWLLPQVRPRGLFWQQGRLTLTLRSGLQVRHLSLLGCRQSSAGALAADSPGATVEFQCYDPDSRIEWTLSPRQTPLRFESGLAVRLGGIETTGQVIGQARIDSGARFELTAAIAPHWIVDSVVTDPPTALADWDSDSDGGLGDELHVRLAQPITPGAPLRFVVSGRRLDSPLGETLELDDLRFVEFKDAVAETQLVNLQALGAYQLRLTGDDRVTWMEADRLTPAEAALFSAVPTGLLFHSGADAAGLGVSLDPQAPRYAAEIRLDATVRPESVCEEYSVRIVPESAAVDRVVMRFTQHRSDPLSWRLEGHSGIPAARLLSSDPSSAPGESWEVVLPRPMTDPFVLRAARCTPFTAALPVSLAAAPQAASQSGTVVVRMLDGAAARIDNRQLSWMPREIGDSTAPISERGLYRYDPSREGTDPLEPALVLDPRVDSTIGSGSMVWDCAVVTRFVAVERLHHAATLLVENNGVDLLMLSWPPETRIELLAVDGVPQSPRFEQSGRMFVDLPANRRWPTVTVRFDTPAPRRGWTSKLADPTPQVDAPVQSRHWSVLLPPGYALLANGSGDVGGGPQDNWRQRMFGVLAPESQPGAFNPFSWDAWLRLGMGQSDKRRPREIVAELVDYLGATGADRDDSAIEESQWGGRLQGAAELMRRSGVTLLIDQSGLAAAGINPDSPFPAASGDSAMDRGLRLIERSHIAIVACDDVFVVTDSGTPPRLATAFEAWQGPNVGGGTPCAWADAVRRAAMGTTPEVAVTVAQWIPEQGSPWANMRSTGFELDDAAGWARYDVSPTTEVRVARGDVIQTLRWGLLLLASILACRTPPRWKWALPIVAAAFALASLMTPLALAPIPSGGFLGTMLGLLIGLALHRERPAAPVERRSSIVSTRSLASPAGILILVGLAFAAAPRFVQSDESPDSSPELPPTVHHVIVPVDNPDAPGKPRYYLVPEDFLAALQRHAGDAIGRPRDWIIERAAYRAELTWDGAARRMSVAALRAEFDVHVFGETRQVLLPMVADEFDSPPTEALLDGSPVPLVWNPAGRTVAFDASGPGPCRLELPLRLKSNAKEATNGLAISIPVSARATLELLKPIEAPAVDIDSARGGIVSADGGRRLLAEIGPADRLHAKWTATDVSAGRGTEMDVEQLLWMRVQPGSMVLHARFQLAIKNGSLRSLRLAADPRLRVLPGDAGRSIVSEVRTEAGDPQILELVFDRPQTDAALVDVQLLLTGASGLGRFRLPRVDVLDARSVRRFLAVSVDSNSLTYETSDDAGLAKLAIPTFAERWGDAGAQPQAAWQLPDGDVPWRLATRPAPANVTVDRSLSLVFDRELVELRCQADLRTRGGPVFQRGFKLSPAWSIDRIEVTEDGAAIGSRWVRGDDGSGMIFLAEPAASAQRIEFHARRTTTAGETCEFPTVGFEGTESGRTVVELFRRPDVSVEVVESAGMEALEGPGPTPPSGWGRSMGRFAAPTPDCQATFRALPNNPASRATQVAIMHRERDGTWSAELRLQLRIEQGVIDELRCDIPREWAGPFAIDPPGVARLSERPGSQRRQLTIRPRHALQGDQTVTVRSPLALPEGAPVRALDARLKGPVSVERFVVLPTQIDQQPIGWTTRGLRPADWPMTVPPLGGLLREASVFQVMGPTSDALLRLEEPVPGESRVLLSDNYLAWQADGSFRGTATFDVSSAGAQSCSIGAPANVRLTRILVDGGIVQPAVNGPQRWMIALGPSRLPQRIEIAYLGQSSEHADDKWTFDAPLIESWEVAETLWTVDGPDETRRGAIDAAAPLDPRRHDLVRLKSVSSVLEQAMAARTLGIECSPPELATWFRPWSMHAAALLESLDREIDVRADPEAKITLAAEARSIARRIASSTRSLGLEKVWKEVITSPSQPAEVGPWDGRPAPRQPAARAAFVGTRNAIVVHYPESNGRRWIGRLWVMLAILGLTTFAVCVLRRTSANLAREPWLPLLGAACGLVWWLFLAPSILGFGIVVACLIVLARRFWKPRPEADSSIVELAALK